MDYNHTAIVSNAEVLLVDRSTLNRYSLKMNPFIGPLSLFVVPEGFYCESNPAELCLI
jgi:hypothetical protein